MISEQDWNDFNVPTTNRKAFASGVLCDACRYHAPPGAMLHRIVIVAVRRCVSIFLFTRIVENTSTLS
jgi:hypothetical protein